MKGTQKLPIQNFIEFSKSENNFNCKIGEEKLDGLENILKIVEDNYSQIEEANFFEFGSAHYNLSTYTVRSAKHSHFMGFGTNLNYKCFDAYVEENDFDVLRNLMNAFNKAEKITSKITGITYPKYNDPIWDSAEKKFLELDDKKDFADTFVRIKNEEYYKKFFGFYDKIDLDKLKKEIKNFSVKDYSKILNEIKDSKNQVIFSQQVFNCPNLSQEYPFWKIEKGFQIHRGNIRELSENLNFDLNMRFRGTAGRIFDNKEEFVTKFQKRFDLQDKNVQLVHTPFEYFLFWQNQ